MGQTPESDDLLDRMSVIGDRLTPLDFVGTFSNRWSYGIAFGATANKVMFLFSEGYQPLLVPQWAQGTRAASHLLGISPRKFSLRDQWQGFSGFIVIEFCVFVYVRDALDVFEGELESYITSMNQTGTPALLQVKELINITKALPRAHAPGLLLLQFVGNYETVVFYWPSLLCLAFLLGRFLHIFVKERNKSWFQTRIYEWDPCFQFPSRMIGTIVLAFICLYLEEKPFLEAHQAKHVRQLLRTRPRQKHIKRLWAGDKHFLPLKFHNPSSSESVSLCGLAITYSLVLPVIHHRALEMLQGLGIGILTVSIVLGLVALQVWIAASFFLQPKMGTDDKQKPLALNNRRAFHNFNYFLFFYNVLLGLGACLSRLFISCVLGTWLIARIDRTILQSGYERADMGFRAWIGMLYVDHYHTNPVLVSFCHILITGHRQRRLQQTIKYWCLHQSAGPRLSARSRTRWLLLQTLINNRKLVGLRKPRPGLGSQELAQTLLTCSES
ncbi:hypothetical protein Celaphus_00018449 [Cervus elaphus hippelaphus]|uniref:STRA6 n=1 Tax=Cervus elaphus hippelaphus TaxID=46360 RepID=A0A212C524_CEREH|nr:hypothetical protein Celaphus_00018449 [Cervus elaphus hippelaphus]